MGSLSELDRQERSNRILAAMYRLTPPQVQTYHRLCELVDEALDQFEQGYAVNVEPQMAQIARDLA
ncbi:hypothetical protein AB0P21_09590 [Kribbella sp. NPDC056861]|uniref:hypothetical protein n=1 Tax=Kribbella sp. NPDC056861 TaxID=3154857 RepID=UPI00343FD1FC